MKKIPKISVSSGVLKNPVRKIQHGNRVQRVRRLESKHDKLISVERKKNDDFIDSAKWPKFINVTERVSGSGGGDIEDEFG